MGGPVPPRARIALTLGDPAGIGPEIVATAAGVALEAFPALSLVLVGPAGVADRMAARLGPRVEAATQRPFSGPVGRPSAESGRAALEALSTAIALAQRGEVQALTTAPLSKEAIVLAGSTDRGHTEILERELGRGPVAMAFFGDRLRVALITAHLSVREMLAALSMTRVVDVARLLADSLRRFRRVGQPRLALAGLNPHAGENGLMGDEEGRILAPAVAAARAAGIALDGPFPADTLFRRAYDGEFDGVVAIYHDQALIPVKLLGLGASVHLTLGLKVLRTSPDHGTAFELVGTGRARPEGMISALKLAAELLGA